MRSSILVVYLGAVVMLLAGCAAPGPALGPDLSYTTEKTIAVSKRRLYQHSWDWLAARFRGEHRQVELADRKAGKIVATVRRDVALSYQEKRPLRFRIQIDVAIEQYRLVFDQPAVALGGAWYPVDGPRRDVLGPQVIGLYQDLAADYQNYLAPFEKLPWDSGY
jgi:hypothetical protein